MCTSHPTKKKKKKNTWIHQDTELRENVYVQYNILLIGNALVGRGKKKEKKKDQGYQKARKGRGKEEEGLRSHSKAKHGQQKVGGEVEQTRPSIKRAEMQWHQQNTAVLHGCKVTKPGQRIRPKHTLTNPPRSFVGGPCTKAGRVRNGL